MEKENRYIEYKVAVSKSYLKTVSAYANYNDGEIIFGISDDYKVVGITDPINTCLDIENQINDSIKPRPDFTLKINSNQTISLFVKQGRNTPYRYDGKAYKRSDSSSVPVDEIEEKRLILAGMNIAYEELSSNKQDLEFTYLEKKLCEIIGLEDFNLDTLKSLGLYSKDTLYNNAAALLADANNFPGLDIAVFGDSINIFRKRITLSNESVLKQYFDTIEIFKSEYIVEKVEGSLREKIELIPFEAFREALANALVHRTWDVNINAKVEMHPDKIIISSPGGLLADMTKEDYVKGNYSFLRNPILANVFRRLKIIETFATGIKRINAAYKDSLTKPIYDVTPSSISVTLPIIDEIDLNNDERKVFDLLKEERLYSRQEIENMSGYSKDKLVRILNSLLEKGVIEKVGQARATYYKRR